LISQSRGLGDVYKRQAPYLSMLKVLLLKKNEMLF
jgi:hypothetical protein